MPPMTSTTMSMSPRVTRASASAVNSAGSTGGRPRSRPDGVRRCPASSSGRPTRAARSSACSVSRRATSLPTTPQPSRRPSASPCPQACQSRAPRRVVVAAIREHRAAGQSTTWMLKSPVPERAHQRQPQRQVGLEPAGGPDAAEVADRPRPASRKPRAGRSPRRLAPRRRRPSARRGHPGTRVGSDHHLAVHGVQRLHHPGCRELALDLLAEAVVVDDGEPGWEADPRSPAGWPRRAAVLPARLSAPAARSASSETPLRPWR